MSEKLFSYSFNILRISKEDDLSTKDNTAEFILSQASPVLYDSTVDCIM